MTGARPGIPRALVIGVLVLAAALEAWLIRGALEDGRAEEARRRRERSVG